MSEKNITQINSISQLLKPMNPKAMNYLKWFMSDSDSLRNWAGQIFNSDVDLNSPKLIELKNAAEITLLELDDDIARIREFLAAYVPPNKLID